MLLYAVKHIKPGFKQNDKNSSTLALFSTINEAYRHAMNLPKDKLIYIFKAEFNPKYILQGRISKSWKYKDNKNLFSDFKLIK